MKISEVFYSLQGEGVHTGVPSIFIRFFGCNLQCQGFGQAEPSNPSTWKQPWKDIDTKKIHMIEELPEDVYQYGCDSVYSWAAKFKGLQLEYDARALFDKICSLVDWHDVIKGKIHLVFTGGEPLLWQNEIAEFIDTYVSDDTFITFETNGTLPLSEVLFASLMNARGITFSVSPKLLHTSGEQAKRAIKPGAVATYNQYDKAWIQVYLKFVVNASPESLNECLETIKLYDSRDIDGVYVMPEGPNKHRVNDNSQAVAEFALKHQLRFTHRLHNILWDNKIGV